MQICFFASHAPPIWNFLNSLFISSWGSLESEMMIHHYSFFSGNICLCVIEQNATQWTWNSFFINLHCNIKWQGLHLPAIFLEAEMTNKSSQLQQRVRFALASNSRAQRKPNSFDACYQRLVPETFFPKNNWARSTNYPTPLQSAALLRT